MERLQRSRSYVHQRPFHRSMEECLLIRVVASSRRRVVKRKTTDVRFTVPTHRFFVSDKKFVTGEIVTSHNYNINIDGKVT